MPPTDGRYRVFIIDEVHMLSTGAFNAFLKTLEEPPSYVIFILATTEKHKIIPTILSRCQIYDFNRITIADMIDHLGYVAAQEHITAEPAALNVIARKADGAMRDALSIFDQVAASSMGTITYRSAIDNLNVLDSDYYSRLLDAFLSGNVPDALLIYQEIREHGFDSHFFITGLADYFRDLMVARDPRTVQLLEMGDDQRQEMSAQAARCTPQFIFRAMELCNDADLNYRTASNKQFLVELTLIRLCQAASPSPGNNGDGEGQLKKITPAAPTAPASTATAPQPQPTPQRPTAPTHPAPAAATPGPAPAAPAQRPAPAAEPMQPATPRKPRTTTLGPSLSINRRQPQSTVAETTPEYRREAQRRTTPYTDQALDVAWESYIAAHPEAMVLIHTMNQCRPRRREQDSYIVVVESQPQLATMRDAMPALLDHIHNCLANDSVTIEVAINEGEGSPQTWTEREIFAHLLDTNPSIKALTADLHLTLA